MRWFSRSNRIDHLIQLVNSLHFKVNSVLTRLEEMVTKDEVLAAVEQLKLVAANEKVEVVTALTEAVQAAVAPLEAVITQLREELANAGTVDLSEVLAAVQQVTEDVGSIVEISQGIDDPEMPTEPMEPVEVEPVTEEDTF